MLLEYILPISNRSQEMNTCDLAQIYGELSAKYKYINENDIMYCLEDAIMRVVSKYIFSDIYVVWFDYTPMIYYFTKSGEIRELKYITKKIYKRIEKFFFNNIEKYEIFGKFFRLKKNYMKKIIKGVVVESQDSVVVLDVGDKDVLCILEKDQRVKKEKEAYKVGNTLLVYSLKVGIHTENNKHWVLIKASRSSKTFVTKLLEYQMKPYIEEFMSFKDRKPFLFCYKRIPGVMSYINSELYVPTEVISQTREVLYGERVNVSKIRYE